ncbi:MAG: hypothetical protein H7249_05685 [Chitinophagaceae bacterium]|nr:hypothetical protein [Oligoflexus sp.]
MRLKLLALIYLSVSAVNFSCKTISRRSSLSENATPERADAINSRIVAALDKKYPREKGSVWSSGTMILNDDFIVQSPNALWGADAKDLSPALDCLPSSAGTRCDRKFLRLSCESDNECPTSTHCTGLEAAVTKLGDTPPNMCLGPSDHLLNRFYRVMVSAESELDITSLSMFDGRFRTAVLNALTVLTQKQNPPLVRMLFSGANASKANIFNTPTWYRDDLEKSFRANLKDSNFSESDADKIKITLAWLSNESLWSVFTNPFGDTVSWNHSKVIVADGKRALSGGHNMWDADYLRINPIFDTTLEYGGQAAADSRNFLNRLWSLKQVKWAGYPSSVRSLFAPFSKQPDYNERGNVKSISVGRLGVFGANVSDDAIIELINSAENTVYIIQQDLYNQIVSRPTATFALNAIVEAAFRGVSITIVQSNKFPIGGYGAVAPNDTYRAVLEAAVNKFRSHGMTESDAKSKACRVIIYAPFRFSSSLSSWPNAKNAPIGSHTKLVMADDSAFYIGSHNLYKANLQEFGNIVTDAGAASRFKYEYWDKVWEESKASTLACPYR